MNIFSKKHLFFLAVWGEKYIKYFTDISLPSLMTDQNLGVLKKDYPNDFIILSTTEGKEQIIESKIFPIISKKINIQFWIIDKPSSGFFSDKYKILSNFQNKILKILNCYDFVHFIYPDFVYGNGTFKDVFAKLEKGYGGYILPVPRIDKTNFEKEIEENTKKFLNGDFKNLNEIFENKSFTKIATPHFTESQNVFFQDEGYESTFPSSLMWKIPNKKSDKLPYSILFKCYHLHPLTLKVQKNNPKMTSHFTVSLDEEYISNLYSDIGDLWCSKSSNEAAICSLDDHNPWPKLVYNGYDHVSRLARFAERSAGIVHRQFAQNDYVWFTGTPTKLNLDFTLKKGNKLINRVQDRMNISDSILFQNDIASYKKRVERQKIYDYSIFRRKGVPPFFYDWNKKGILIAILVFQLYSILYFTRLLRPLRILRYLFYKYATFLRLLKYHNKIFENFRILARAHITDESLNMKVRMYDFWLLFFEKFTLKPLFKKIFLFKLFLWIYKGPKYSLKYFLILLKRIVFKIFINPIVFSFISIIMMPFWLLISIFDKIGLFKKLLSYMDLIELEYRKKNKR